MSSLAETLTELLEYRRGLNTSAATLKVLQSNVRLFLAWLRDTSGVTTPDRLGREHLYGYQKALGKLTNHRGLPCAAGTINNRIAGVRSFLGFLYDRRLIVQRLDSQLQPMKAPRRLPTSVLNHAQVQELLAGVDTTTTEGVMHRTILELLYTSGMRVGELVGVGIGDLDLDGGLAKVCGKGSKERMVPIGRTAGRWLESYLKGVRPLLKGAGEHRALFLNRRGKPLGKKSVQAFVAKYAAALRLEVHVTPHTFRRSCTTELIRGNANLYHVKELLGHESLSTLKPYTRLTITDLRETHARCHPSERDA
jgi:site-specific recombinase XerD